MKAQYKSKYLAGFTKFMLTPFFHGSKLTSIIIEFEDGFNIILAEKGIIRAYYWYFSQVIKIIAGKFYNIFYWSIPMFKNYLKVALRNIRKQKVYSIINMAGLSAGFAGFILIMLYIQYEMGYDMYHKNADRIIRIIEEDTKDQYKQVFTPGPLASALKEDFPEIETATRFYKTNHILVKSENNSIVDNYWFFSDEYIFDIFTLPMVMGDPKTALVNSYSVVISEELADQLFGSQNPVGQTITYSHEPDHFDFTVTGILKNMPDNSHFKVHLLSSLNTFKDMGTDYDKWYYSGFHTYALLREGADLSYLEDRITAMVSSQENREPFKYHVQKLGDVHLRSAGILYSIDPGGDIKYIYIFSVCAFFILFIACVNYMNLSIARSAKRCREVGVRKVAGAFRSQLIIQFLCESVLMTFASFLIAAMIVYITLQPFETFLDREITNNLHSNRALLFLLLGAGIFTGIFSGSYPAFFISGYKPIMMLKGVFTRSSSKFTIKNILVVVQFTISIFLIISTIVVSGQLKYIQNLDPGFDLENILIVNSHSKVDRGEYGVLKNELLKISGVEGVTFSRSLPLQISWIRNLDYKGRIKNEEELRTYYSEVDNDFFRVFSIELSSGINLSTEASINISGGSTYIINEEAQKSLGWESSYGKKIMRYSERNVMVPVAGLVKDFHNINLHSPIEPLVLYVMDCEELGRWGVGDNMSVKIHPENQEKTIADIKKTWDVISNGWPLEYTFMDDEYNSMYRSENRLGTLFSYFSLLSIIISCLGLFGLASFTIEQSTKETGIRKVFGAKVQDIFTMLSWSFIKWVILANVIAIPAAHYWMNKWLEDFAYRIDINIFMLAAASFLAFIIALGTVSFHTLKAARANPVDSLRYE
ncbi:MAG: hypothetical protein GY863_15880 [bacterium]|nr:hypothetical protein [bacterium]